MLAYHTCELLYFVFVTFSSLTGSQSKLESGDGETGS